ncbi:uncharacterized protein B0T23DRAFT_372182 [Neurospora hispaniola]|uniref:Secreted protein n=1 Tax=Neurospora hispaniola TaxID=588809 RepID=A0AAJ0IHF3_9PEZI|nr:hypothetical protein B0T23DRAFT_372182 [Neurospora hispaniola]
MMPPPPICLFLSLCLCLCPSTSLLYSAPTNQGSCYCLPPSPSFPLCANQTKRMSKATRQTTTTTTTTQIR